MRKDELKSCERCGYFELFFEELKRYTKETIADLKKSKRKTTSDDVKKNIDGQMLRSELFLDELAKIKDIL